MPELRLAAAFDDRKAGIALGNQYGVDDVDKLIAVHVNVAHEQLSGRAEVSKRS